MEVPQIFCRLFKPGWIRQEEMEPSDNVDNTVFTAHCLCLFHNITDTCMRAAGDNQQSFLKAKRQRRIVKYMILFGRFIGHDYFSRSWINPLEFKIPLDRS
jgi:hypothetical protein